MALQNFMDNTPRGIPPFIGTISLTIGAIVVFLLLIKPSDSLGWSMPTSWYTNRSAWVLGAAVCLAFGSSVLYSAGYRQRKQAAEGAKSPSIFESLTFYTRRGCHLCDEAFETLGQFGDELPEAKIVDIDVHPELFEKFDTCVPVVEIDGRVRFRGKVDPALLRRLIDGAESAQVSS